MTEIPKIPIARGRTAEVFAWQDRQILKLFYDWMPASSVEREAAAARLACGANLPTPKLFGDATVDGRRGLIYERVSGASLLELLASRPWLVINFARRFAGLHASILRLPGSGLPPLKSGLEAAIRRFEGLSPDLRAAVLKRLAALPDGTALCHMDFHPGQVMVTAAGEIVLDWMTASSGDPAADVARTMLLLRSGTVEDVGWLTRRLIDLLRGLFFRTYMQRCLQLNPAITKAAVQAWLPPVAAGRLAEGIPGDWERLMPYLRESLLEG